MRTLPDGIAAGLATGATTHCRCWRIARRDGVTLGFTDHDLTLEFEGVRFEAEAGVSGSELKTALGLSLDNLEATGRAALGGGDRGGHHARAL